MAEKVRWGIIGCGGIARRFASGLTTSETGSLSAVASRSLDKAERFAEENGARVSYGSYEDLLSDPHIDAVYIATPHTGHAEWAVKAAEAGKHILCEKPLAVNFGSAMQVVEAVRANDVVLMEGYMYRSHPQTAKLFELTADGAVGEVRFIEVQNGFPGTFDPASRLFDPKLAGGGIMDVGGYPVSFARLIAGAVTGRPFADPVGLQGYAGLVEGGVDGVAGAVLSFGNGLVANAAASIQVALRQGARIYGTKGRIEVPDPWQPDRHGPAHFFLYSDGASEPKEISVPARDVYGLEADALAAAIAGESFSGVEMTLDDSLGNMSALDRWRDSVGLQFPFEQPEQLTPVVPSRGPQHGRRGSMPQGGLPKLEKPLSRLLMGAAQLRKPSHAFAMFDDYFERGGTAFDTGYIYGNSERVLGSWIANRGVREDVIVIDKGAHTPHCTPEWFAAEFRESLDRLQTDYVDIYMLHRDNPDIPAGEFVDAMNQEMNAGRICVLGVSNWSTERVDEANAYAEANGLARIEAVSNNLSLARMVSPPWPGAVSAWEPEVRRWHRDRGIPLIPWSSQAKGFFVRTDPNSASPSDLVRSWYADDNFERLRRARELARRRGTTAIAVALAWVLHQDFAVYPLIGPQRISETRSSMEALNIDLSPQELAWLNLEE